MKKDKPFTNGAAKSSAGGGAGDANRNSLFVEIISKAGITLKLDDAHNQLSVDDAIFQKNVTQGLRKHASYPKVVDDFISSLQEYVEGREAFKTCLLPCRSCQDSDASTKASRESLIKLLLGVNILQTPLMNALLEKLPEFMEDGNSEDGVNIPRLTISHFKWLDRIYDSTSLTDRILELLTVAPLDVQRDIITCLPEIIEDDQHTRVAKELSALMQQNTQLTVVVLDVLSNINLSSDLLAEVRGSVMLALASVELDDLPVVVKFILHSITATDAYEVIAELRTKLDFQLCLPPASLSVTQGGRRAATGTPSQVAPDKRDCKALVLDAIASAVRFQKTTAEAWIKAIESVRSESEHKVIDFLVLLILHINHHKAVESLVQAKVRAGRLGDKLLQAVFSGHTPVTCEYFPSILALAQTLLRSPDPVVASFAGRVYCHVFFCFDPYYQQEVVGSLVTFVCNGYTAEVDTALQVLHELVQQRTASLASYAVFIKGILDYLENLSLTQIRKLFFILSTLAFSGGTQGSYIQGDMHIVVRKQLSSTVLKYKRIGIIGAIALVGSMATRGRNERTDASASQASPLSTNVFKQVTTLVQLVRDCCDGSAESTALYCDELATLIHTGALHPKVQAWIGENILTDFQDDYVVDVQPGKEPPGDDCVLPMRLCYNLEEEEDSEGSIAINLLPLLANNVLARKAQPGGPDSSKRLVSHVCLASHFRLLRLGEEALNDGNLEGIDALLGCPLYVADPELVEKVESLSRQEREWLCTALFLTLNWFREVVNAFCRQSDAEMKAKVLRRLENITEVKGLLERCLAATPGYKPPTANFDSEGSEGGAPAANSSTQPKKKTKGKKRKADGAENTSTESLQGDETMGDTLAPAERTQDDKIPSTTRVEDSCSKTDCFVSHRTLCSTTTLQEAAEERPQVSLASYRAYMRELDIHVFGILQMGLLTKSLLDSHMDTKVTEVMQLGPAELMFLLDDLTQKLDHVLTTSKRTMFLKVGKADQDVGFANLMQHSPRQIASHAVHLLASLCDHLEGTHNYFQMSQAENDGLADGPHVNVQETQVMSSCYQLLLQTLNTLFSWSGFVHLENKPLLKDALGTLALRLKPGEGAMSMDELLGHAFSYLRNFSATVPSCELALTLTRLLMAMAKMSPEQKELRKEIVSVAQGFLKQHWVGPTGEREKGSNYSKALEGLLCIYLDSCENVLDAIEDIAIKGVTELVHVDKDGHSATYPTLTRAVFGIFYRVVMERLEKAVKAIPAGRSTDSDEVQEALLMRWSAGVRNFHMLVNLIKTFDGRQSLRVCLKYGRLFVEAFLKKGMPLLDCTFKKYKDEVNGLLKNLQLSTRQLHHMCGHSKVNHNVNLMNCVPQLKRTLESFVYRVKAMLTVNKCHEAFWIGNLKNRNLHGEEILSQDMMQTDKGEDSETEASVLAEDDDEDEEMPENAEEEFLSDEY
nr:Fanconi anemia group D2 protein isoform X2 [Petromyzon marinus]